MIPKEQIFSDSEMDRSKEEIASFGIVDNTPLKRAKEMYSNCIEKARVKHSSSTSRSLAMDRSDFTAATMPNISPLPPVSTSVSEEDCMKVQIDLLSKRADLISPKPVRVKLIWLKDDNDKNGDLYSEKKRIK
jgi:hypothetical protein